MRLFGLEIKRVQDDNKYVKRILPSWFYNRDVYSKRDKTTLLEAYRSWVYICVSRNSATASSIPLKLYVAKQSSEPSRTKTKNISRKTKDSIFANPTINALPCIRKAIDIEEVTEHRFYDLMRYVNDYMSESRLFELTYIHQDLVGDAYWYIKKDSIGKPAEIWILPPNRIKIVPDENKFISHYNYYTSGSATPLKFETDEIIHFLQPHPTDPYYGFAPLEAVLDPYNILQSMFKYEENLMNNSAQLSGIFTTPEVLDEDNYERLKDELKEVYQGLKNAGNFALFDGNMKFEATNLSPKELGYLQGRKELKTEIFEAFDNPTALFDKSADRANAEAAHYVYMKFGITPRLVRVQQKLNEQLIPMYDDKLFVAYDNAVPEDKEFILNEQMAYIDKAVISRNEVRIEQLGKEPVDGLDEFYLPMGMMPVSMLGQYPLELPKGKALEEAVKIIAERVKENMREELANSL